jgi:ABC-type polysaccharide/polyol phosphate transport system ATPase subunit
MIGIGAEVVLADEVLAIGDAAFRKMCEEQVEAVGASGVSVLFVSHDMAAIRRICSRVIWIDRRIMRSGQPTRSCTPTKRNCWPAACCRS